MPLFYWDPSFAAKPLSQLGGLLDLASAYFEQFFVYPQAGPWIAVSALGLVWALTALLLRFSEQGPEADPGIYRFPAETLAGLPACFGLAAAAGFDLDWMPAVIGAALALGCSTVALLAFRRDERLGWVVFVVLAPGLCRAGGLAPAFLFALTTALARWSASRRVGSALGLMGGGAAVCVAMCALHRGWARDLAAGWGTGFSFWSGLAMRASIPALVGLGAIRFKQRAPQSQPRTAQALAPNLVRSARKRPGRIASASPAVPARSGPFWGNAFRAGWLMALAIAIAFGAALARVDDQRKAKLELEWAVSQERWDDALAAAGRIRAPNWSCRLNTLRALCHQGRLLDCLFDYPQRREIELLPGQEGAMSATVAFSAFLMDLGHWNLAEHFAHEGLEQFGDRPDLLRLLIKIHVLKNRPKAAAVYLEYLRKNPIQRAWAESVLARLKADPSLSDDPEMVRLRGLKINTDYPSTFEPAEVLLKQALDSNPANRMAFDCLMAHLLLNQDADQILKRTSDFSPPGAPLPRSVEEALVDIRLAHKEPLNLGSRSVTQDTVRRVGLFIKQLSASQGQPQAAQQEAVRDFANTYWHYKVFGFTPGLAETQRSHAP